MMLAMQNLQARSVQPNNNPRVRELVEATGLPQASK
jgi:hypothetical protein